MTLLLCADPRPPNRKVLSRPLLYLSLFLKRNRDAYYDHLQRIRVDGAWEAWLRFFLTGVIEVSGMATDTTRQIVHMVEKDRHRIHSLGRAAGSAQQVHDLLAKEVMVTIPRAGRVLPLSEPTVAGAVSNLEKLGVAREITGRSRGRVYVYDEYLALLNEGTQPLDS